MRFHSGISDHTLLSPGSYAAEIKFFAFAVNRAKKAFAYPRHLQTTHQLIYFAAGSCLVTANETRLVLRPGQVFFAKSGESLGVDCAPGTLYYSFKFSLLLPGGKGNDFIGIFPESTPPGDRVAKVPRRFFSKLTKEIEAETWRGGELSPRIVEARSKEFFWQAVRFFSEQKLSPAFVSKTESDPFRTRLAELFARSLSEKISVPEMAAVFAMSESAFAHLCRKKIGCGPAKAFARYRLDTARKELLETSDSIREIAFRNGFVNPFHFSKVFSASFSISPARYRKKALQK